MPSPVMLSLQKPRMWIHQAGDVFHRGDDGQASLSQKFHAALGQGEAEAERRGFARGAQQYYQGYLLILAHAGVTSDEAVDIVELQWVGYGGIPASPRKIVHKAGDEEWNIEAGMDSWDSASGVPFYNADGETKTPDPPTDGHTIRVPKLVLVWRKWIKPPWQAAPQDTLRILPRTQADAYKLINTYYHCGGTVETGGPRIGCVLGSDDKGMKYLCIDISLEPDGALLCRTAKFEGKPVAWNIELYPTP